MKDGRVYHGILWMWRPEEGWFQLAAADEQNAPDKFWFRDVESAVTEGQRVGVIRDEFGKVIGPKIVDEDEIERARNQGWDGK